MSFPDNDTDAYSIIPLLARILCLSIHTVIQHLNS